MFKPVLTLLDTLVSELTFFQTGIFHRVSVLLRVFLAVFASVGVYSRVYRGCAVQGVYREGYPPGLYTGIYTHLGYIQGYTTRVIHLSPGYILRVIHFSPGYIPPAGLSNGYMLSLLCTTVLHAVPAVHNGVISLPAGL